MIAILFLKPAKLRDSVDLAETPEPTGDKAPVAPGPTGRPPAGVDHP
ncbi:hypothetical protein ACBR40_16545 [Nonomuraea sp. AD125B]